MSDKKSILILTDYYLPGFKAGGPIRSIEGFVSEFSKDYNLKILTRDRDINDKIPYENVILNNWCDSQKVKVYYLKKDIFAYYNFVRVIRKCRYDLIYINSFFSPHMSIFPIILRALGFIPKKPVIIAPRGEFSVEAMKIRSMRKLIYIKLFSFIKTNRDIFWQASTNYEKDDIINTIQVLKKDRLVIAGNLSRSYINDAKSLIPETPNNHKKMLRLIFISRISEKKNLDYALSILAHLDFEVEFDIYGPIEDGSYWNKCLEIISNLPNNIKVKYCGALTHETVISRMMQYDLFFFPTRGENYGHVIEEAIHAGLPVLISDQTPWKNLRKFGIGSDISLLKKNEYIAYLKEFNQLSIEKRNQIKKNILIYSSRIKDKKDIIASNRYMIKYALSDTST